MSSMWSKIANFGVVTVRPLCPGAGAWVIYRAAGHRSAIP
jgi:hypothetical protein